MKKVIICDNDWVTLNKIVDPENGVHGYVYSHEKRCKGHIVSVLPFRKTGLDNEFVKFLLRLEVTPCWSMEDSWSSITGGVENDDPVETAVHEILEEAGYTIKKRDLIDLGTCRGTKSCDTLYHLFTVDLTNKIRGEAKGDGSELEAAAKCYWRDSDDIAVSEDPLTYVSYFRINNDETIL